MPSDGGTHQSPTSPLCSTVGTHERLAFYLQAKYEVVYATKVVGEHSHPKLSGGRVHLTKQTIFNNNKF